MVTGGAVVRGGFDMNTQLPRKVINAIARAVKRINRYDGCEAEGMEIIIAEELEPVLKQFDIPAREGGSSVAGQYVTVPVGWTTLEGTQRQGCVGTRYCHTCKISYGGTCLCMPIRCHECKAECGTTPPATGQMYEHRMHY